VEKVRRELYRMILDVYFKDKQPDVTSFIHKYGMYPKGLYRVWRLALCSKATHRVHLKPGPSTLAFRVAKRTRFVKYHCYPEQHLL
jgi:hypothetical protein